MDYAFCLKRIAYHETEAKQYRQDAVKALAANTEAGKRHFESFMESAYRNDADAEWWRVKSAGELAWENSQEDV